jgi:hypothetical protein
MIFFMAQLNADQTVSTSKIPSEMTSANYRLRRPWPRRNLPTRRCHPSFHEDKCYEAEEKFREKKGCCVVALQNRNGRG